LPRRALAISDALVAILDPDVVPPGDDVEPAGPRVRCALVTGTAGIVCEREGRPLSVGAFTFRDGRIVQCDFLVDPERVAQLGLEVLQG
jgi:hypothetical protein